MSVTNSIAALQADVKKLTDLLDDAHPGLSSWHAQYQRALEGVAEWLHPDDLRRIAARTTNSEPDWYGTDDALRAACNEPYVGYDEIGGAV